VDWGRVNKLSHREDNEVDTKTWFFLTNNLELKYVGK
jgi:hypothetical protein